MRGTLPDIPGFEWDERTDMALLHRSPRPGRDYTTLTVHDRGDHYKAVLYDSGGMTFRRGYADTIPAALCDAEFHTASCS